MSEVVEATKETSEQELMEEEGGVGQTLDFVEIDVSTTFFLLFFFQKRNSFHSFAN